MKKLLLSAAVLTAVSLPALAQDEMFRAELAAGSVRASDLIGARIYASAEAYDGDAANGVQEGWTDIGEINDVVVAREGNVEAVLVDIGGFLGMGERQVAVDMTALNFVSDDATADNADDWFLVMTADQATLEGAPELAMTADGTATDMAATEGTTADPAATTADPATDTAVVDPAADPAMATDGTTAETAADPAMTADGATAETAAGDPIMRDGYSALTPADLTAEMLQGATVYDVTDDNIGEVGELVLGDDGQVQQMVIDVGGFLGMGEKPVALSLDQVNILRAEDGSDVRVYLPQTKEELEAMPDYQP